MLTYTMPQTRLHAAADCTMQSKAVGTWMASGRAANVAVTAAPVEGTGVSTARTRFAAASQLIAPLPFSAVVVTDVNAGIRSWSPPV